MTHKPTTAPPNTVYSPPAPEVLRAFARTVCLRLGTPYHDQQVVEGFSAYIQVAAKIHAQHLTQTTSAGVVDNGE